MFVFTLCYDIVPGPQMFAD